MKRVKLFYLNSIIILSIRQALTVGCLLISMAVVGQMDNVWLLHNIPQLLDYPDSAFTLDFNTCPAMHKKTFLQKDESIRSFNTKYNPYISNGNHFKSSFCDTNGHLAFTELLGQHYYNKDGFIYDSTYINNNFYAYYEVGRGAMVESEGIVYYFQVFHKLNKIPSTFREKIADSIIICVSSFNSSGQLLNKNKIIYRKKTKNKEHTAEMTLKGKVVNKNLIEIILTLKYDLDLHLLLNYNLSSGNTIEMPSIPVDSILTVNYSTHKKILISNNQTSATIFDQQSDGTYKKHREIMFNSFITPRVGYKFDLCYDFCFSPNDSIIYSIVYYAVKAKSKPNDAYLLAFNFKDPYNGYKFVKLKDSEDLADGNNYSGHFLKLGPDGNIYLSGFGMYNSKFKIIHPNILTDFKVEKMPQIVAGKYDIFPNYFFPIATIEDYKHVEFTWKPNCKGLGINFTNLCDTQFFKRYRLFFGNGDSMDLGREWKDSNYSYKAPGKYFVKLKSFSKIGGYIWYGDSIEINMAPKANFDVQQTKGCQWIGYKFTDSSQYYQIKSGFKPYKRWFFGDGFDSLDVGTNPSLTYTYNASNTFTVKLVINNGYCTDTSIKLNKVLILPAPKPGIIANPLEGCTPLKVSYKYKYTDALDSAIWNSGQSIMAEATGILGNFIYNQTGYYWLSQKLFGPSGCVTMDSVQIKVIPGITGMPDILYATVTDENTIDIKWKEHLNAVGYTIIKNNSFLSRTKETNYTDQTANTLIPNSYTIRAISSCNDSTTTHDLALTIYLKGQRTDSNQAVLDWTPYQNWDLGVKSYQVLCQNDEGYFVHMATLDGQTLKFLDTGFARLSQPQRCYKVIADESAGNLQLSESNVYCIPLKPTIFIPSAFSPNGDGINDSWGITYRGIERANLKIFNRWGEQVYEYTSEKPEWDGTYKGIKVPIGAYFYQIVGMGIKHERVYNRGLVEVVR